MYTSVPGQIVECIEFIWGIYTDIFASYLHMDYFSYVEYLWHLRGIFFVYTYMAIA